MLQWKIAAFYCFVGEKIKKFELNNYFKSKKKILSDKMDKNKTCTDTFSFESEPFFQQLRKTLPTDTTHSQNLIECKDDMIFAWNSTESSVLVLNWRTAKADNDGSVKFQVSRVGFIVFCVIDFLCWLFIFFRNVAGEFMYVLWRTDYFGLIGTSLDLRDSSTSTIFWFNAF